MVINSNKYWGRIFIKISCYFMVFLLLSPMLQYYITFPFSALPLLFLMLGVVLEGNYKKTIYFANTILLVFLYSLVLYLGVWRGFDQFYSKYWVLVFIWLPVIFVMGTIQTFDKSFYKNFLSVVFVLIAFTCITTLIQLHKEPYASRYLATGRFDLYDINRFLKNNTGGYGFIYSLVLIIPALIYVYKKRLYNRAVALVFLIIIYFCIFKSQYSIAIIFSVASLPLFFLKTNTKKFTVIVVPILLVVIFRVPIANFLLMISSKIDAYSVRIRIAQLASLMLGTNMEGSDDRIILYKMSIKAFMNSPFIGMLFSTNSQYQIGRHSELLDLLGATGLLGFALFYILFRYVYKRVFAKLPTKKNLFFKFSLLCFFVLGMINTLNSPMLLPTFIIWHCILQVERRGEKS